MSSTALSSSTTIPAAVHHATVCTATLPMDAQQALLQEIESVRVELNQIQHRGSLHDRDSLLRLTAIKATLDRLQRSHDTIAGIDPFISGELHLVQLQQQRLALTVHIYARQAASAAPLSVTRATPPSSEAFEGAVHAPAFNVERVQREYSDLAPAQRQQVDEFIWIAAGRPATRDTFRASDFIGNDTQDGHNLLQRAVNLLQAHRRVVVFCDRIAHLNIRATDNEGITAARVQLFDSLVRNENDKPGQIAQIALVKACAFLRGMDAREHDVDAAYDAQAIGNFDAITKNAVRILVENKLTLLPTTREKQALVAFVSETQNQPNCTQIQAALRTLKNNAPLAYNLLLTSFANGLVHSYTIELPDEPVEFVQNLVDNMREGPSRVLVAFGFFLCLIENGFGPTLQAIQTGMRLPSNGAERRELL